jgi:hypothetical protein
VGPWPNRRARRASTAARSREPGTAPFIPGMDGCLRDNANLSQGGVNEAGWQVAPESCRRRCDWLEQDRSALRRQG